MSKATYYVQECPTCGRRLQVRVEYLGRQVVCRHCSGKFFAEDPATTPPAASSSGLKLIERADELLQLQETRTGR